MPQITVRACVWRSFVPAAPGAPRPAPGAAQLTPGEDSLHSGRAEGTHNERSPQVTTDHSGFGSHEDPPIYQMLVSEQGDVIADSRAAADAMQQQAFEVLSSREHQPAGEARPETAGSPDMGIATADGWPADPA